jgi:eukaryotic-like serine/threonine-protein kinase
MHAPASSRLIAGRYRLNGQIGHGAMGTVWRGRDELLDRDVAVKEVRLAAAGPAEKDTAYQRTLREAKTAARLSHPGLITVFDVVEEDGSPWIVMELVRSRSLDQVVAQDGPLRPAEAAAMGQCLLSALACAHAAGVLHRDVKPSNVLITPDGGAVLTDFGIATFEGDPSLTQAGMVVGTPSFTAPERIKGEPATPASDLWSLGATLYTAVEGRGPFDRPGGSPVVMAAVVNEDAPRAPSAGPLGPVIEALLRTSPADRPDAGQAAQLLSAAAEQARPGAPPAGGQWPGQAGEGAIDGADPDLMAGGEPAQAGGAASAERRVAEAQTVPAQIPDLLGSPAFADVHEFPDLPAVADAPSSMELPAFMDLPPFAEAAALPPGQSVPWGQDLAGSADLLNEPGSDGWPAAGTGSRDAAGTGSRDAAGTGSRDAAGTGSRDAAGTGSRPAAGTGSRPAAGTGSRPAAWAGDRGGQRLAPRASQPPRRGRALLVLAGVASVAAAAVIGWALIPRPASSSPSATGDQGTAAAAAAPGGTANRRGSSGGQPGGPAGGNAASNTQAATGGSSANSSGKAGGKGSGSGSGSTGSGTGTGGAPKPAPANYRWLSVSAATAGTAAGFKVAVPIGWQVTTKGFATYLHAPVGSASIEINLATFAYAKPLHEAQYLNKTAATDGQYPGYQLTAITPVTYRDAPAATWRFTWKQGLLGRVTVLEYLFGRGTPAGRQDYALSVSAPTLQFPAANVIFDVILTSFQRQL